MRPPPTAFPHPDLAEEGPPLTAALCALSREDERYWQHDLPRDHEDTGVLAGGPAAEPCVFDADIGYTHCAVSAPSPDAQRLQYVVNKGRHANPSGYGLYGRPRKPVNSGRKRKVA